MTDLHSSQIRSLAEAANNITNPITEVKTVEEGVLGNVAKKIIQKIKDIKSDYAEWRDLAKQLSQLKQERDSVLADIQVSAQKRLKELDTEMHRAAIKAIKELNAELDRLKVTDKERLGETVETVEEAVAIDKNMNIKAMVAVLKDIADALMGKNVVTQRERLKAITQVLASKRGFVTEVANSITNPITEAPKADDQHGTVARVDRITKFLKKYPDPSKLKAHHLDNFFNHPDYFGETDAASDAAMKKLPVQHRKQIRAMRKDYDDRNW